MDDSKPTNKNFIPKPGQKDFTNEKVAPVINSVLECGGKILLVRRSDKLGYYPGFWSGITGFLDDDKTPEDKLKEEIWEELGIGDDDLGQIESASSFEIEDSRYSKKWIIHPLKATVLTKEVELNWEAEEYVWILPEKIYEYSLLPSYDKVFKIFYPEL